MIGNISYCILSILNFVILVNSARILGLFPIPSISHQVVFREVTRALLKRGHEITVITTDPEYSKDRAPENLTEIDIHDISYNVYQNMVRNQLITNSKVLSSDESISTIFTSLFEAQLNSPQVKELVFNKTEHFDLIIIEGIIRPAISITYVLKAPIVLVNSVGSLPWLNDALGIATHPILYPSLINRKLYNLTLFEKAEVIYKHFKSVYDNNNLEKNENLMLQKYFGPHIPSLSDLYGNIDLLLLNVHPIWMNNQPSPPNVVYMGGIHQKETKDLPQDLKTYLDSSKHGVIYLSFGTNALASMIPKEKVVIMAKVLSNLPYDVLWKWDQNEIPIQAENIKLSKWFPQADLLKHPNIKLFITQAGLQSSDEAITAGVPLVAIPMIGDQWYNAEKYVSLGIGIKLLIEDVNLGSFKNAVETAINDKSYRENIVKLRKIMQDQPQTPLERSVWWIEHIIRHGGGKHLRTPGANISRAQYFEIEVLLVMFSLSLIVCIVLGYILLAIYRLLLANVLFAASNRERKMKIN